VDDLQLWSTGSTLADVAKGPPSWKARLGRRLGVTVLTIVLLLGALGVFGVHSRTIHVRDGAYSLTLVYPQSARAGLDAPWRLTAHHDGGWSDDVTIAVSASYFHLFETQGFYPNADSSTGDGSFVYFTFTKPPAGRDLVVDFDAYVQPSAQLGKRGVVQILVDNTAVVSTSFRTWLVP